MIRLPSSFLPKASFTKASPWSGQSARATYWSFRCSTYPSGTAMRLPHTGQGGCMAAVLFRASFMLRTRRIAVLSFFFRSMCTSFRGVRG